ncbi:MAG: hypothetical protein ABI613_04095 [Gemmatimonadota bacterium]
MILFLPLAALLTIAAAPLTAQNRDAGTLSIRSAGREIGREEFVVQNTRQGGASGTTIVSRTRSPSVTPQFTQEAVLERRPDGSFVAMQVTRGPGRVLAELARNTVRVRTTSVGSEAIRELAAPALLVGLADSAFALYTAVADLATPEGRAITGLFPVTGKQVIFTAQRLTGDGDQGTRIIMAGEIAGTIWMDDSGRVTRLQFPASGIEIVRLRQ